MMTFLSLFSPHIHSSLSVLFPISVSLALQVQCSGSACAGRQQKYVLMKNAHNHQNINASARKD